MDRIRVERRGCAFHDKNQIFVLLQRLTCRIEKGPKVCIRIMDSNSPSIIQHNEPHAATFSHIFTHCVHQLSKEQKTKSTIYST